MTGTERDLDQQMELRLCNAARQAAHGCAVSDSGFAPLMFLWWAAWEVLGHHLDHDVIAAELLDEHGARAGQRYLEQVAVFRDQISDGSDQNTPDTALRWIATASGQERN